MRVIVQHRKKEGRFFSQYAENVKELSPYYQIVDIEEKYLSRLNEIEQYIEPNYTIGLCESIYESSYTLKNDQILFVSIGAKLTNKEIDAYYNMKTHTLAARHISDDAKECWEYRWINCYSDDNQIGAADYIQSIYYLKEFGIRLKIPIFIWADLYVPNAAYRYRSLTHKIISSFLSEVNGGLVVKSKREDISKYYIPLQKPFEFYLDHAVYLEGAVNEIFSKVLPMLYGSRNPAKFKQLYREHRVESLYNDVFYQTINPSQEIYVLINLTNFKTPEVYRTMGFEFIPLMGSYGMLYGPKSRFDEQNEQLKSEVALPYYLPILSYPSCIRESIASNVYSQNNLKNLKYKGEGIYIGIITTDDVDYTHPTLRTSDGASRIAYIWQQTRTNEGNVYVKEQINEALMSPNPSEIIRLPEGESISTMMLAIAGGQSENLEFSSIAVQAEFVTARVNTAPEILQRLYGGMPSKNAAMMPDVLIGMLQLINFAKEKGRPLVLCIPFNTNIDAHDGTLISNEIIGLMARREGVAIIIPAGEEADKQHHYSVGVNPEALSAVDVIVQKENQNVVGLLYQRLSSVESILLYPPKGITHEPINLKIAGITRVNEATIYSNGYKISFLNGAIRILLRFENLQPGRWQIEIKWSSQLAGQIDFWISQQELNEHIILSPSIPFTTIGSLGNTRGVITVGSYDRNGEVVERSSGRGYSWDNRIEPLMITHSSNITAPCGMGQLVQVTGTLPAAGVMLGVAATIYNKCIRENIFPLPNTLVIGNIILSVITQSGSVVYPNPSQGYGVFDVQTLNALLNTTFAL